MKNQELNELSQEEINERVAILRRFKELLSEQREKFRSYLKVLEQQEYSITSENIDSMVQYSDIEHSIVSEIFTIQKLIDPIEYLHQNEVSNEIPKIRADLALLQQQVLNQNKKNQALLQSHMDTLRTHLLNLHRPYKNRTSIYASTNDCGTIIDLRR